MIFNLCAPKRLSVFIDSALSIIDGDEVCPRIYKSP